MERITLLLLLSIYCAFSYSYNGELENKSEYLQELLVSEKKISYQQETKLTNSYGIAHGRILNNAHHSGNISGWKNISHSENLSDWQDIYYFGNFSDWQESTNHTKSPSSQYFEFPTISPTHVVTTVTTISPSISPTPYILPSGPYISALMSNERVRIPVPPLPNSLFDSDESRSNCPHLTDELLDWHDNRTWSGMMPESFENVTLPENSRIVIRKSVAEILGFIFIPSSSELIFGENHHGITFDTKGILVEGKLIIGSKTCRIGAPITITLHGSRPIDVVKNIPPPEYKGISVTGTISLHGKRFYRTWTRLALTVNPGDSILMLQDDVNWVPGQTIVLVTTALKDSREWHKNELAVVKQVILKPKPGVGAAVVLEKPVMYQHLAFRGYQGEVGLISRSIKIQGNAASEPTDPDPLNCLGRQSYNGDKAVPCPNTELTGFGGHIIVHSGGKGYVEGSELFRMGQTNVMGRYPMHFHLLGRSCPDCYFRDSSVHRSFYRCISIHATDLVQVSENVAYDITGFCYYLEEGVEQENRIEFNLGAHIHLIGPEPPSGYGQYLQTYEKSDTLNLPADVAACAFYITNVHNYIIGNSASGGWAGFAFPLLTTPLGFNRFMKFRPSNVRELLIDGNTAHSTAWWWKSASAFYFGGSIYYNDKGVLEYQAGRDMVQRRSTCLVDKCSHGDCGAFCKRSEQGWMKISNSKAFLIANVGLGSWSGRVEIHGYECHDCGMSMEALSSDGFFAQNVLVQCRSQIPLVMPKSVFANKLRSDGFRWYDTGQEHIISGITFRNCGYRSKAYDQYDKGLTRGCGDEKDIGCMPDASVWIFVTHSDQHVPEIMQATRGVKFENCGRRFRFHDFRQNLRWHPTSVSAWSQNWLDMDGSITGFNERSVAASGVSEAGMWWQVDHEGKTISY
jgi:hypothetical protein